MLKTSFAPLRARIRAQKLPLPAHSRLISSRNSSYTSTARLSRYTCLTSRQPSRHTSLPSLLHTRTLVSTKPLPTRGPLYRFIYRSFAWAGAFILTTGGLVVAFFIYDASTYNETPVVGDVPVSLAALNPPRGGPKNLPIVDTLIDDDDTDESIRQKNKPRLVILGSGWGSVALLKTLRPEDYHITVVSPVNYFLFTPMLPSATVGTLELRSLVEPIRRIVHRVKGHFLKANAVDVEFSERLVEISQKDAHGVDQHFYIPYDKLVVAVGRQTSIL
jgi:NADH:ubiquinone reductase (H+-translocating)